MTVDIVRAGDLRSLDATDAPVFMLQETDGTADEYGDLHWETTEGIWFTRDEAETWARAHHYRMRKWRVYSMATRGELKTLLKAHTDYSA